MNTRNIISTIKKTMQLNETIKKVFLIFIPEKDNLIVDYNYFTSDNPREKFECTLKEFTIILTWIINDPFFDGKINVEYGNFR